MNRIRLLSRLLFLAPLLALAAYVGLAPDAGLPRWAIFTVLAAYARLGALALGAAGSEKALLFAETLPFLAYAHAVAGREPGATVTLSSAEGAAAAAALLSVEALVEPGMGTFTGCLVFVAFAAGAGVVMGSISPAAFLAAALLVLAGSRYAALRRSHP